MLFHGLRAGMASALLGGTFVVASVVALSGCGGGGGSSGTPSTGTSQPVSTTLAAASTLAARCAAPRPTGTLDPLNGRAYGDQAGTVADEKNWLRSWTDETYLWYRDVEALSASVRDPSGYATAIDYFDALRTRDVTASGKAKDAYHFSIDTATWVAEAQNGVTYGYGFQVDLVDRYPPRETVVVSVDAGSTAAANGIARGAHILTVDGVDQVNDGTQAGIDALNAGLFPTVAGTHVITLTDPGSSVARSVTLTATPVTEIPVRNVMTLPAPYQKVGYIEFDDHIATSERMLIDAISLLKASGVTDLVLDLRYNGGGYLDIASELAYMIAGPTATGGKAFDQITFNDKNPFQRTAAQTVTPFHDTSQGFSAGTGQALPWLGLSRVHLLVGGGTCSASESIINGLRGIGVEVDLIGGTTCGKPYGFYATDNCSTTYFSIQFKGVNALGYGDYADGFAPTCPASDDYGHALGDPAETLLAMALGHLTTSTCMASSSSSRRSAAAVARDATVQPGARLAKPAWRENRFYRPG